MKKTTLLQDNQVAEIKVSYASRIKQKDRIKVTHAFDAEILFRKVWDYDKIELQETFKAMLLNRNNQLLGIVTVADGGITSTQIDMRLLIGIALKSAAVGIILAHNHPSGNCKPSASDFKVHEEVQKRCKFFYIEVLDHIILTKESFYSFAQCQMYGN